MKTKNKKSKIEYVVGIDTGVRTGIAQFNVDVNKLVDVYTCQLHVAFRDILAAVQEFGKEKYLFVVEDARKRKKYGTRKEAAAKIKGAGSIERDAKAFEEFMKYYDLNFRMIHPMKGGTKWNHNKFAAVTGWKKQTNEHNRDAGVIAWHYGQSINKGQ